MQFQLLGNDNCVAISRDSIAGVPGSKRSSWNHGSHAILDPHQVLCVSWSDDSNLVHCSRIG